TVISVAVMIVAMAFTNGFQFAISQKIFSFWGHIRVQHFQPNHVSIAEELPIEKNDTILQMLRKNPGVESVNTFATKNAILKTNETIEGILFKGVEKSYDFRNIDRFLEMGRWVHFPDSGYSNDINLSAYTARQLKLRVNDKVLIYFIQSNGSAPRARKLNVAGIYKTGIDEYDKLLAVGDMRLIQRLNDWTPQEIGGYEIFVKEYDTMDSVNSSIFYHLPAAWNSQTTRELNPNIFDWLNLQDQTIVMVLIIMTLVAVLNLITCLIILVLERTRMTGVLKALGASNGTLQRIFLYHGIIIALSGIILGNLLGLGICLLQQRYGFIPLPEEMYYISKAEVNIVWWHVVMINLATLLIAFLVLIIPTFIIRRVQPVKAIKFV
ncbi:MAG: ABC transporter permease, partial [Chitinophagaceae bacterium]|nr:ABC transporter permease [Chitinophagaceae bacterium]